MSHLSGREYSNLWFNSLRFKEGNKHFCVFSLCVIVLLMQQHIKKVTYKTASAVIVGLFL